MKFNNYKFEDVCSVITDYVANGSFKSLSDNVKYLNHKDYARLIRLIDNNSNYKLDNSIWVSKKSYDFLSKSKLFGDEIIVSNVGANLGTVFKCPHLNYPMTLGPNSILITTNDLCNQDYMYYYLKSTIGYSKLMSLVSGSAMPKFNKTDLRSLKISLPDRIYQDKSVKILSTLDKKIELNNQINDNLYELIILLLNKFLKEKQYNFIDLRNCVRKINTGADAITKAPIVDYDTGIRCIRIGDMTNNHDFYSWGFVKMNNKNFENYKLNYNDIVITRTAVNGLTYFYTRNDKAVCNNGNIRLTVNEKFNPLFIYLLTKTQDFKNYINRINSETSVRPNMKVEYFERYQIPNIPIEIQNKFCNFIEPLRNIYMSNKEMNHRLNKLRDTLLSKLINGEIDLENIEI